MKKANTMEWKRVIKLNEKDKNKGMKNKHFLNGAISASFCLFLSFPLYKIH